VSALDAAGRVGYRRRASPLHAARATVAAGYGGALALSALLLENPILLAALLAAVLLAASAAGVGGQLLGAARASVLPLLAATVLINVLVNRGGLTVFARLGEWGVLGQVDLTLEAVVYGLVFGLRLLVVALACLLVVCAADPDELLLALRRVSPHSALTAALATRMVGVLGADARRLAEAQRCRADGGARGTRARIAVLRATVQGALDRALDGAGRRPDRRDARHARSRHDVAFACAAVGLLAIVVVARAGGAADFTAYPRVSMASGPATLATALALLAVALVPFADRRGIQP
jgi:energy-coupling factor transport system permease protein